MAMSNGRYCVIIEELHAEGWVVRRMLVARFVALGDAVAYAMHRRDTCCKPWRWVVEVPNAIRSLHEFEPEPHATHGCIGECGAGCIQA